MAHQISPPAFSVKKKKRKEKKKAITECFTGMCTCVEVEDARRLPLHSDRHVVPLYVGGADASVGQLDLEEATAALHVVQRRVAETRLYVRLVGVKGLVEDVLHDLGRNTDTDVRHYYTVSGVRW